MPCNHKGAIKYLQLKFHFHASFNFATKLIIDHLTAKKYQDKLSQIYIGNIRLTQTSVKLGVKDSPPNFTIVFASPYVSYIFMKVCPGFFNRKVVY